MSFSAALYMVGHGQQQQSEPWTTSEQANAKARVRMRQKNEGSRVLNRLESSEHAFSTLPEGVDY